MAKVLTVKILPIRNQGVTKFAGRIVDGTETVRWSCNHLHDAREEAVECGNRRLERMVGLPFLTNAKDGRMQSYIAQIVDAFAYGDNQVIEALVADVLVTVANDENMALLEEEGNGDLR